MDALENVSLDEGGGLDPNVIDDTNYADDEKVATRVRDEILSQYDRIREIRLPLQQRWDRFRKCYDGIKTKSLYDGRSQIYWRLVYKIVETFVAHIKTNVFPTLDTFEIEPSPFDPMSMINAPIARRILRHDIEQAMIERWMDMTLRNGLIDGCSIVKWVWKQETSRNYKRVAFAGPNGKLLHDFKREVITYEGPTFMPVDLLNFYVHPITVQDISEARVVFEDVTHNRNYLQSMAGAGQFSKSVVKAILADKDKSKESNGTQLADSSRDDRLGRDGITMAQVEQFTKGTFRLQEAWVQFDLYDQGYDIPCQIVSYGDQVLQVRQHPFFLPKPPYGAWKVRDKNDNFYGAGIVEAAEHLNIAANAVGNQFLDAVQMQTNHILGVNIAMLGQDVGSLRIAPRAIWPALGNPNEVFAAIRPPDNTQTAMTAMQLLSGVIQDICGAPAMMQGKFSNADKTATEINAVAQGAGAALAGMVRNVESQLMSPMLQHWWMLEQQFRAVETEAKLVGRVPMRVAPIDMVGDYSFRWLTSSQVSSAVAQFQKLLDAQQSGAMPGSPGTSPPGAAPAGPALPSLTPSAPTDGSNMGLGTQPSASL